MPEFKTKEEYEAWKTQRLKELKDKTSEKPKEPIKVIPPKQQPTEKKCRYCAMMIPKEARICPHCRKNQPSLFKSIMAIIAIALFVGPCIFIMNNVGSKSSVTSQPKAVSQYPTNIDACVMSTHTVEDHLKAPSTAKFPWTCLALKIQTGAWNVRSYVDAQNSFGAMIRTHYVWTAEYNKDKEQWHIIYFKLGDQELIKD